MEISRNILNAISVLQVKMKLLIVSLPLSKFIITVYLRCVCLYSNTIPHPIFLCSIMVYFCESLSIHGGTSSYSIALLRYISVSDKHAHALVDNIT